jgi:hypothetical protein
VDANRCLDLHAVCIDWEATSLLEQSIPARDELEVMKAKTAMMVVMGLLMKKLQMMAHRRLLLALLS